MSADGPRSPAVETAAGGFASALTDGLGARSALGELAETRLCGKGLAGGRALAAGAFDALASASIGSTLLVAVVVGALTTLVFV
jgi:hypothetical protein